MRLADIAFGIPFLPFVIVLAAFLKPSIWNVVIAMALVLWRDTARVIRSQVLTLRSRGYVDAARVAGSSDLKIILRHIAPNILPLSFLYGSIAIGWAILTEASISFLGFGDPESISLGLHAPGCVCEPSTCKAGVLLVRSARHLHHPGRLRRILYHARAMKTFCFRSWADDRDPSLRPRS